MPLFQSTVLKKHTNALDTATVDAAYERFKAHFLIPVIKRTSDWQRKNRNGQCSVVNIEY